jgi:uncharacterized LabA/DUF88 family protein
MTKIKRCLYVDGSNLFGGISELLSPGEYIDFKSLLSIINEAFNGVDKVKFYGAYMGLSVSANPTEKLFVKTQNEFFNSAKLKGVHFGHGSISRHGQEKGVDMQLGVDMVNDAHLNLYDDAILLSGDADFDYPVRLIKKIGKNLHYCSIATRYSNTLAWQAWKKVVLDYEDNFNKKIAPTTDAPKKLVVYALDKDRSVKIKSVSI